KIMHVLVENGFIETMRGRNGGIRLARPATEITLGEVVRVAEGSFVLSDCFDIDKRDCPLIDSCGFSRALHEALAAFFAVLDSYTIAEITENRDELVSLLSLDFGEVPPQKRPASLVTRTGRA